MAIQFKCPSCGSSLAYDAKTKKLLCDHCGYSKEVPDFESKNYHDMNGEDAKTYTCSSCGAQLITDENTSATFCNFCGNPTLIEDRLLDEAKPSGVVPFTVSKEQAKIIFRNWTKKGILTPKLLKKSATVEKMTGMYVPFWLYDYKARSQMKAKCTKTNVVRQGDYQITYTKHYVVNRDIEAKYNMIPADASEKMEDHIMDLLEPFEYQELVPFEMPYLSGFYAEKFNYAGEDMLPRIQKRVNEYITDTTKETIIGYSGVAVVENHLSGECMDMEYVLMPVWTLFYRWKNKNYMFTINGQTGKVVADRPVDPVRGVVMFFTVAVIIFALLFVLGGFFL